MMVVEKGRPILFSYFHLLFSALLVLVVSQKTQCWAQKTLSGNTGCVLYILRAERIPSCLYMPTDLNDNIT